MPTSNDFRRVALAMEGAVEREHMGYPDFRVNNRIFATLQHDDRFGMVVLTPEQQRAFLGSYPGALMAESGAWGLRGCTRVRIDAIDEEALGELMALAWRGAAAKPVPRRSRPKAEAKATATAPPRAARTKVTRTRTLTALLALYPKDVQRLARATRSLMMELWPGVEERVDSSGPYVSYGYGPGYTSVVGYMTVSQKGVKLGIAGGASLPDPKGLLQGSGKSHRHVAIASLDDLRTPGLRPLVRAALAAWKART